MAHRWPRRCWGRPSAAGGGQQVPVRRCCCSGGGGDPRGAAGGALRVAWQLMEGTWSCFKQLPGGMAHLADKGGHRDSLAHVGQQ